MFESLLEARRRASMDVHFFDIAFQAGIDGAFSLLATDSRGRQASEPWTMPLDERELAAFERDPSPWRLGGASRPNQSPPDGTVRDLSAPPAAADGDEDERPDLDDLGRRLFASLFRGEVGRLYDQDVGYRDREESLCIVLTFNPTDDRQMRLSALPWECLHGGRDYLGLSGRPIVRRLRSSAGEAVEPLETRKLRILAVPLDDTGLDLEAEQRLLRGVQRQSGAFDLEIVPRGFTLLDVRRRLEDGGFHVLHLMGHGSWSVLERAWGVELGGVFVTATELARQLRSELSRVRLVVLNTCHSARTLDPETAAAARGLAAGLVEAGALAVVANGAPITDGAARALTHGLYHGVAVGWSLPHALTSARLDLHGEAEEDQGVRPGEWTTPRLHLRFPGRVLVVRPRRWPVETLAALVAGGLGLLALVATAGVWLAYPDELGAVSLALGGVAWGLAWGWIRDFFADSHPLSGLADALARKPRPTAIGAGLILASGLVAWMLLGVERLEELPCIRQVPGVDWSRSLLVDFSSPGGPDAWDRVWLEDLERRIGGRLGRVSFVPKGSDLGGRVPRSCFAGSIEGRVERTEGGPVTRLRVEYGGRKLLLAEPGAPSDLEDPLWQRILAVFGGDAVPAGGRLSQEIGSANVDAVSLYRQGDFGHAREVLEGAVARDPDAALLRGNLAQILFDMARQVRLRRRSVEHGSGEQEEKAYLAGALRHLDVAIDLEPDQAMHYFHRGRVHLRVADAFDENPRLAEADFRASLERRPLFPEAANDLAVLLLDRDGAGAATEASTLLEKALLVVDPADRSTLAAIWKNLGRARQLSGERDAAWQAYERAECLAPPSRLDVKAEALGRSAELLGALLGPASADVAWWRYSELLRFDADAARRQDFIVWRSKYPHRPERGRFRLWSKRCGQGEFAFLNSMPSKGDRS